MAARSGEMFLDWLAQNNPLREVTAATGNFNWSDGFAERLIGSIRRECAYHIVVLGEKHLRRVLKFYATGRRSPDRRRRSTPIC